MDSSFGGGVDSLYLDYIKFISRAEANANNESLKEHKKRLKERLELFGCAEKEIESDGNCQFAALADQLFGDAGKGGVVRSAVINWLRKHPDWNPLNSKDGELRHFVAETWDEYCTRMSKSGQWGDHVTLLAAAEVYDVGIRIISSIEGPQFMTEIDPSTSRQGKSIGRHKTVLLSHWSEFHYSSISESEGIAFSVSSIIPPGFFPVGMINTNPVEEKKSHLDPASVSPINPPMPTKILVSGDPPKPINTVSSDSPKPTNTISSDPPKSTNTISSSPPKKSQAQLGSTKCVLKIQNMRKRDIRRVSFPEWPTIDRFQSMLEQMFKSELPRQYCMKYKDDEGDLISISTQEELGEATQQAKLTNRCYILRLEVHVK